MFNRTSQTDVEDLKDPDEALLPTCNFVLIAFREDESEDRIPFTPLDHLPVDLDQGSVIETSISRSLVKRTTGQAHVIRLPIASRTDWLISSNPLPFNLLQSVWHTPAQSRHSSM